MDKNSKGNQNQLNKKTGEVNCFKCKHYFITWDKNFPRGCKIYNSKSSMMPSMLVQKETGEKCLAFQLK